MAVDGRDWSSSERNGCGPSSTDELDCCSSMSSGEGERETSTQVAGELGGAMSLICECAKSRDAARPGNY